GNEHANHESHGPTETIMYQIDRLSHPSHVTVESACVLLDIYHVGLDNRQLLIQLHDTCDVGTCVSCACLRAHRRRMSRGCCRRSSKRAPNPSRKPEAERFAGPPNS